MARKRIVQTLALLLTLCLVLSACGPAATAELPLATQGNVAQQTQQTQQTQQVTNLVQSSDAPEDGTYNKGVVLVKYDGQITDNMLSQLNCRAAEPLYTGSSWHLLTLATGTDTVEAVEYLRQLGCFDQVDYDYVMKAEAEVVDVSCNPDHDKDHHHDTHKVPDGWGHMADQDKNPGGSPDVIVAVIDTGVDYNHVDLRNNIWINRGEIPGNGIDDDGNGYIDDVRGWDCVGDDNDPMDDNGHGTHVAGIIAAENNTVGAVGIAYNCKIMVLKAGNSSGYFNNSDIAEAIQYAYMNGASVINMSFGGGSISIAVEDALENAYNQCVLVAAAGNDSRCNQPGCTCPGVPAYPAALPYVIGVMSCNADGTMVSGFSNYDHYPYNKFEYEVYACGENVYATWPGNKYATLNGTSMAAPAVSAIAALLRSYYSDREMYATKFIQSQIVNTGTYTLDGAHRVANAYEALTYIPTPNVNLYEYYIDDSVSISEKNNGNGVIDAGETVRLFVSLMNRGGVASNVNVTIDTMRSNDPDLIDPYFTFPTSRITFSDIGTYSVREAYEDEYFEIVVGPDCPNDYLTNVNIRFTYENGLDAADYSTYSGEDVAQFGVSRGYHLPAMITEDTVYTADRLYIVGEDVVIPKGVTVTFEEGCKIQFYDDRDYHNSPKFVVYGLLEFDGTKEKMISLSPGAVYEYFSCHILVGAEGAVIANYLDAINLVLSHVNEYWIFGPTKYSNEIILENSILRQCVDDQSSIMLYEDGVITSRSSMLYATCIKRCYIQVITNSALNIVDSLTECFLSIDGNNASNIYCCGESIVENNIFCTLDLDGRWSGGATKYYFDGKVENNIFCSSTYPSSSAFPKFFCGPIDFSSNSLSEDYQKLASQIIDNYYDSTGTPIIDVYGSLADASLLWPHVVSMEIFDKAGNPITRVGKEEIKVRVTFNRPMDTTQDTFLTFGTIEPYADYRINGAWTSGTVWEGTYTLKSQIENGQNYLKVNNACAAEDPTKVVFGEYQLHEFTIDTTAAMSMNLQAVATYDGIRLTWAQDDYDTLLGYNIYRSEEKDGYYTKLNSTILLPTEESFLDDNAEPGKTYWYTYTVVLSDFTESKPAGRVACTGFDTIRPNLYHTPVNQGYANNNLVISCTASDNIGIQKVTLYYRTAGTSAWKSLNMSKQNDKYSATIFGSDVTLAGIEYYIVAVDGGDNAVQKGSAETPYTVLVKDAALISRLGDVDNDGAITMLDALMIIQHINGDINLSADAFERADLNKNGKLDSVEALRILQYINGNVNSLEM